MMEFYLNLTPQQVIDYFRNSPVLNVMLDDVMDVLAPLIEIQQPTSSQLQQDLATIQPHLSEILDEAGQVRYRGQSVIARLLGGSNAGYFRQTRVLPVVQALQSSTTSLSPTATRESDSLAA